MTEYGVQPRQPDGEAIQTAEPDTLPVVSSRTTGRIVIRGISQGEDGREARITRRKVGQVATRQTQGPPGQSVGQADRAGEEAPCDPGPAQEDEEKNVVGAPRTVP